MRISDPQVKLILKEEIEFFVRGQKILAEHKRLVLERKDFHSQAALLLIEELTGKPVAPETLDEGLWSKAKAWLGKLGSLERGKGPLGAKSKKYRMAAAQINRILGKQANKEVKKLRAAIEKQYKNFPNNEDQKAFVDGLSQVAQTYDSLKQAVEKGDLPAAEANVVVKALRDLGMFYLDHDLSDVYKHFNEGKEIQEQDQVSKWGGGRGSKTVKGLESNIAPAILAAGGALGLILQNAPWFTSAISGASPTAASSTVTTTLTPAAGEGFTQMLGRILHGNPAHFGPGTPVADLFNAMRSVGLNPANPTELYTLGADRAAYLAAYGSATPTSTIAQVFPASNTLLSLSLGASVTAMASAATAAAGAGGAAAGAATTNPILAALGVSLLASGAAVKLLRMKGLKSSRAALLRDLVNAMPDIPERDQEDAPPHVTPTPEPDVTPTPEPDVTPTPEPDVTPTPEPEEEEEEAVDIYTVREAGENLTAFLTRLQRKDRRIKPAYKDEIVKDIVRQLEAKNVFINEAGDRDVEIETAEVLEKLRDEEGLEDPGVIEMILKTLEEWAESQREAGWNIKILRPGAAAASLREGKALNRWKLLAGV